MPGEYGTCGSFHVAHGINLIPEWWCFYDAATGALAGSIFCGDTPNACGELCDRFGDVGLCCDELPTPCASAM
jgi:hypothetical protein